MKTKKTKVARGLKQVLNRKLDTKDYSFKQKSPEIRNYSAQVLKFKLRA